MHHILPLSSNGLPPVTGGTAVGAQRLSTHASVRVNSGLHVPHGSMSDTSCFDSADDMLRASPERLHDFADRLEQDGDAETAALVRRAAGAIDEPAEGTTDVRSPA